VVKSPGWEAKRRRLGVHVTEMLEALESIEPIGPIVEAGTQPEPGASVRLRGMTSSGRVITLVAQVHRLPMVLEDIAVDAA
jgi:hypothetical protein